jgi:hypothetical protein
MNKPDWNIGPDNATHWAPAGLYFGRVLPEAFYRVHGDIFNTATEASGWEWSGDVFKFRGAFPGEMVPRAPEWDGSGVPPPGTLCELLNGVGVWGEVEITAVGRQHILIWVATAEQERYCSIDSKFRPRQPKPPAVQLTAREQAIERMYRIALEATGRTSNTTSTPTRRICEALYDSCCAPAATVPATEYDYTAAARNPELVSALKEALYTADNSVTIEMASHLAQELVCQGFGRSDLNGALWAPNTEDSPK